MNKPNVPTELLAFLEARCPENRVSASDSNDYIRWHLGRRSLVNELRTLWIEQNPPGAVAQLQNQVLRYGSQPFDS